MSSHNAHRHLQSKPSVGTSPKRWSHSKMITFFTICVGLLGLALLPSVAMAKNYLISIELNVNVTEGPGAQIQFDVTLDNPVDAGDWVEVDFNTANGTALFGSDYQTAGGRLKWDDATPQLNTITVNIVDDAIVEGIQDFLSI